MPTNISWVSKTRQAYLNRKESVPETPRDVFLCPKVDNLEIQPRHMAHSLFLARKAQPTDLALISLKKPQTSILSELAASDPERSKSFWGIQQHDSIVCVVGTDEKSPTNEARRDGQKMTVASYFALYYSLAGHRAMLGNICGAHPEAMSDLVPLYHDLITRRTAGEISDIEKQHEAKVTTASQTQQVAGGIIISPDCNRFLNVITCCIDSAEATDRGPERLKHLERAARMVTHFLSSENGLHRYVRDSYHEQKLQDAVDIASKALEERYNQGHAILFAANAPDVTQLVNSQRNLFAKSPPIVQGIKSLFDGLLPRVGSKERQALCVAVLTLGIANFGTEMVKKYERRKAFVGKSMELVGALLGIAPYAGGALNAAGVIGKTICDAIYEHKADQAQAMVTMSKRIISAFLLERRGLQRAADSRQPTEPEKDDLLNALTDNLLYTNALTAVLALAQ